MNLQFLELAKQIWPGLNNDDLSKILWATTTYPMGGQDEVLADLKNVYEKSGGDFLQALYLADEAQTVKPPSIKKLGYSEQSQSVV